ncbi:hypothetical protein FOC1_g10005597 [Fusarium oxysporum f. sp. cubense race 1]|uniref:Uncharacterized protein n=1 Tax=Fusarium oxysporum f. sp. cubense (strain race 1) TaxID=1229664 RepID=N4U4E9_FUSC1|nr:hypothetical protein FOC1_g10005597 [Fusarium oxysporum f. sp. cubense race 1]
MKACLPTLNLEPGSNWFLRNLTDQEYIRMEAVVTPDDEATISLPGQRRLGLGSSSKPLKVSLIEMSQMRAKAQATDQCVPTFGQSGSALGLATDYTLLSRKGWIMAGRIGLRTSRD